MNTDWMRSVSPAVTDVYTNLNGLQNLKAEKNTDDALKKISGQFESMFIHLLLKNMRSANQIFSEGNMFDSREAQFYQDMHDEQLALSLAHGRGFGIADAMYRQLSQNYSGARSDSGFSIPSVMPQSISDRDLNLVPAENTVLKAEQSDEQADIPAGLSAGRSTVASSPEDFIKKVMDSAQTASDELGVEKEILIAQAALETGWGEKVFAQANGESTYNLFNIKADQRWPGDSVTKNTLEFLGGKFSNVAAKFRSYSSIKESFDDFSDFIKTSGRYLSATEGHSGGMDFIERIHKAGYATDPHYVSKVASVYERVKSAINTPNREAN